MAGEGLSNCEAGLKPSLSDYLKLQTKYIEEKENSLNLEKKIFYLENGLKEKPKQTFQQLLDEKMKEVENKFLKEKEKNEKEMNEKIKKIKAENEQKDEKINLLEKQIKQANDSFNKRIADLTNEMKKLKNIIYIPSNFIKIENKWKEIDIDMYKCCDNKCINTDKTIGECIQGNGFVNLINEENVKYIKCVEGKGVNKDSLIIAENSFKKPQNCIHFSLFYFEIKCMKIERKSINDRNSMVIGLVLEAANKKYIRFRAPTASIINENEKKFKVPQFTWNNNDVFGCGLVHPPDDFPYMFFTQNGKQIGKAVLLKDNNESFKPYILLNCCFVETNFGNNLEKKPFVYDFSKHLVPKFY